MEPFGPQTLAVKAAPVGLEGAELERTLGEVIEQSAADSDEPLEMRNLPRSAPALPPPLHAIPPSK